MKVPSNELFLAFVLRRDSGRPGNPLIDSYEVISCPSGGPKHTRPRATAGSTRCHARLDPTFFTPQPPSLQFLVQAPSFLLSESDSRLRVSGPSLRALRTIRVVSSSFRPAR